MFIRAGVRNNHLLCEPNLIAAAKIYVAGRKIMIEKCETTKTNSTLLPGLAFSVDSEMFPINMDIMAYYCPSNECPCDNTTMFFYEAGSSYRNKLFKIVVDYANWRLVSTEVFSTAFDCPKIIYDFMDSLSESAKSLIMSNKYKVASDSRYVLRDDIDYSRVKIENKVCYLDVYCIEPYEELAFEYEGTQYVVLDHYCVNPKCNCMNALLAFQVVTGGKALEAPVVVYLLDFKSGEHYIEQKGQGVSSVLAEELYGEFEGLLERKSVEPLITRYSRMQKWGGEHLLKNPAASDTQQPTIAQKVGRNSPCPCGSGKKYKKCCGV